MARKDFAAMEARRASGDNAARAALRSRMAHPTSLRLEELQPNPLNPRYSGDDPEVRELAETLTRVGQLQPALIVSRDQFQAAYPEHADRLGPQPWVVLVGNRRLAAALLSGRPALDVRVAAEVDTAEAFEDRILIENLQRNALPPLLEAEQLQRRLDRPGQSLRTVGEAIGKSHAYVQQRLDLLKLVPEFQQLLRNGEINLKTARLLGALAPDEQQRRLAEGPPYRPSASSSTPELEEEEDGAVNRVYSSEGDPPQTAVTPGSESAVNPVSTARGDTAPAPERQQHLKPVASVDSAGRPASPPARHSSTDDADLEQVRLSVAQWLDSALAELDTALPDGAAGDHERALAEAHRHILAARKALRHN